MRDAAKAIRILGVQRTAQLGEHGRRFGQESLDKLADEVSARGYFELFEDRSIDRSVGHVSASFAVGPGSALRPGVPPGSAWSDNRPCRRRDTCRGRPAWRWPSW